MQQSCCRVNENSLIVHIGLHKTGTTWLQKDVFTREDLGFITLKGADRLAATAEFVNVDPIMFNREAVQRRFAPMLLSADKSGLIPVISDERLSSNPEKGRYYLPTIMQRLDETFGPFRILLTIREQESSLLALYRQSVRSGSRLTIREALGTGNEPDGWWPQFNLDFFRYDKMFEYLVNRVGVENICVLPLELLRENQEEYLERLFTFCGVSGGKVDSPVRNLGVSPFASEVQRYVNYVVRGNPLSPNQPGSVRFRRSAIYWLDRFSPNWFSNRIDRDWRTAVRNRVGEMYFESNQRMSELTGFDLSAMGYRVTK